MNTYNQQQQLNSYRYRGKRELSKLGHTRLADIQNQLQNLAQAEFADERSRHLTTIAKSTHTLPKRFHLPIILALAVSGSIITSAGVQILTIALPDLLRFVATPALAAALVLLSEELARYTITTLRLRQNWLLEQTRLREGLRRVSDDYFLERKCQEAALELLKQVEGQPWPYLAVWSLVSISVLEGFSAFWWAFQESAVMALFAAAAPTVFILLASLLLSRLLDGNNGLLTFAAIYDDHTAPQDFAPEFSTLSAVEDSALSTIPATTFDTSAADSGMAYSTLINTQTVTHPETFNNGFLGH